MRTPRDLGPITKAGQIIGGVFGFIFGGVGITVLCFLWMQPFDEFGSPPLFFRIFGSFIALGFVAFGGVMLFGMLTAGSAVTKAIARSDTASRAVHESFTTPSDEATAPDRAGYTCPHCSAPLSDNADVSPRGDVKCVYCKSWFNIHT